MTVPYFTTASQMVDWCREQNARPWVIEAEWWYFVSPATRERMAEIQRLEGQKAVAVRAQSTDLLAAPWEPEPGETEWIRRATAEYLTRDERGVTESHAQAVGRYQATMARWHAAKPWRGQAAVA